MLKQMLFLETVSDALKAAISQQNGCEKDSTNYSLFH